MHDVHVCIVCNASSLEGNVYYGQTNKKRFFYHLRYLPVPGSASDSEAFTEATSLSRRPQSTVLRAIDQYHHVWCASDDPRQSTNLQVRPALTDVHLAFVAVYPYSFFSSYVEDPIWQGKFTAIWCSCLGAAIVISLPSLVHALRQGRALEGFFGVSGDSGKAGYSAVVSEEKTPAPSRSRGHKIATYWDSVISVRQWSVPYVELNTGQSAYLPHICFLLQLTQNVF